MPILRDRPADRLFELDIVGWQSAEPRSFYEAQIVRCRIGLAGGGLDVGFVAPALYRWEISSLLIGLRSWLARARNRASFQFLEREFELDLRGEDFPELTVALREGLDGELVLKPTRDDVEQFTAALALQAEAHRPRGQEWSDLFAKHYGTT